MLQENEQTYDLVCFTDLAYEFDFSDKKEAEKKIKFEGVSELIMKVMLILDGQPSKGQEVEILGGAGI